MRRWLTMFAVVVSALLVGQDTMAAERAQVTPLLGKDLVGVPNREVTMLTVTLAPGESDPAHRHNAQVFVYVLEGSVVMQLEGRKRVTLVPGQTFYEGPNDIHTVGRNASAKIPAKFLVVFVKKKSAPILVPVTSN